jgi:hypothetical protein
MNQPLYAHMNNKRKMKKKKELLKLSRSDNEVNNPNKNEQKT